MIKFKLEEGVELPKYQTQGAEGMDVIAHSIIKGYKGSREYTPETLEKVRNSFARNGYIKLRAFERILFGTGVTVADMDKNLEIQVRPRSGLSLKKGLSIVNTPGTVDSDYRGEIGVVIFNPTPFMAQIDFGERIAQLVVKSSNKVKIFETSEVTSTDRGANGYGSTGDK